MSDPLALTRQKIGGEVRARLGEMLAGNPLTLDTDITWITVDIVRRTDCYYWGGTSGPGAYSTDIIEGQVDYCAVPLYKITSITARDINGFARPLIVYTEQQMDRAFGSGWRWVGPGFTSAISGSPRYAYLKGENSFGIWPVPTYNTKIFDYTDLVIGASGTITSVTRPFTSADIGNTLVTTGIGTPPSGTLAFNLGRYIILLVDEGGNAPVAGSIGVAGSTAGVGTFGTGGLAISGFGVPPAWTASTDTCPLQPKNHMAVVFGVCMRRCEWGMASRDSETRAIARELYPVYKENYDEWVGNIEAEAGTLSVHASPSAGMPFG